MTTAKRIILDCDPGHDDAVAILLALGDPRIEVLGITTIGGNQTLEKVSRNARVVCTVAGVTDVPVYAGCTRPLVRDVEVAADIHGDTGMEIHSYQLPEPAFDLADGHAVDFIIDTIMSEEPGTVTLVPTGPLTNIAMAARKEPAAHCGASAGSRAHGRRLPCGQLVSGGGIQHQGRSRSRLHCVQ